MYISLATSIVFFVLKAIGLQNMAKNQNIGKLWIAWIPFLNNWMQCRLAGSHTLFGKYKTDHLFAFLLTGSIATDVLFYIRTPIAIGFLIVIAGFLVYFMYIMFRDFYAQYSNRTNWVAVIAMLCSPLHAILVYFYCDRAAREPVAG